MRTNTSKLAFVMLLLFPCVPASAGVGTVVRHGGKMVIGKAASKAAGKVAAESVELAAKTAGATMLKESAEAAAKRSASSIAARFGDDALRAGTSVLSKTGSLADDVVKVSSKLTARNQRRLQMMATQMPKGHRELVGTLAKSGKPNDVIEKLWLHRGKLAAGVGAATVLIHGDDIAKAGGEYLVKPVVEQSMKHIVSPVVATTTRVLTGGLSLLVICGIALTGLAAFKPTHFRTFWMSSVSAIRFAKRQFIR
ncbi:hypothetical protein [Roseiconus lacunae]|uniref:hypothetical protein n=1 Tax=Roseiconus lacunae TaxID=2605694 RepID=UPI001E319159|nr:hypothetical protein [Roseiconus lacunae]MCD0458126.1 hypothetical protein [Roseiconus lacunae]